MSSVGHSLLVVVCVLSTSVWIGGYVAIVVVARSATAALEPAQRVNFFRALGRSYLWVGSTALVAGLVSAALLVRHHPWDATLIAAVVVAALLVVCLGVAVQQARRMTRLRRAALATAEDPRHVHTIRRGQHSAAMLRGALGLLSLTLVVLGCFLAG